MIILENRHQKNKDLSQKEVTTNTSQKRTNFCRANMQCAELKVQLQLAKFSFTFMEEAVTERSNFEGCEFYHTDMQDAQFFDTTFIGCVFRGVLLKDALFDNCTFESCQFQAVNARCAVFQGDTVFDNCKISGVFIDADFTGADLKGCNKDRIITAKGDSI